MFNQPIHIPWFRPNAVDDIASPSQSTSRVASPASLTLENSAIASTAAVSASPTLATKSPLQAIAGTLSAQVIVASPTQANSSPVRAVSLPTRVGSSVSTRSCSKRSRNDELSSPESQFRSCQELLRTRLEIPPLR